MALYRVYGATLSSEVALRTRLLPGNPPADLTFRLLPPDTFAGARSAAPVYSSIFPAADGASRMQLYRQEEGDLLHLRGHAEFLVGRDRIDCRLLDARRAWVAEIGLLGAALSLWLEKGGVVALHGSAVRLVEGETVVFLAASTGGKSTLAACLTAAGDALLSDDLLPIAHADGRLQGRPAYPQLRLQPPLLRHLGLSAADWPRLMPGSPKRCVAVGEAGLGRFVAAPQPLAALYLLAREPGRQAVAIEAVTPRDAVIELLRNSFVPRLAEALGLGPGRLALLAELARRVPVRWLRYPPGFARVPQVRAAIRADLAELGAGAAPGF